MKSDVQKLSYYESNYGYVWYEIFTYYFKLLITWLVFILSHMTNASIWIVICNDSFNYC
jgi:hypothetical protein